MCRLRTHRAALCSAQGGRGPRRRWEGAGPAALHGAVSGARDGARGERKFYGNFTGTLRELYGSFTGALQELPLRCPPPLPALRAAFPRTDFLSEVRMNEGWLMMDACGHCEEAVAEQRSQLAAGPAAELCLRRTRPRSRSVSKLLLNCLKPIGLVFVPSQVCFQALHALTGTRGGYG